MNTSKLKRLFGKGITTVLIATSLGSIVPNVSAANHSSDDRREVSSQNEVRGSVGSWIVDDRGEFPRSDAAKQKAVNKLLSAMDEATNKYAEVEVERARANQQSITKADVKNDLLLRAKNAIRHTPGLDRELRSMDPIMGEAVKKMAEIAPALNDAEAMSRVTSIPRAIISANVDALGAYLDKVGFTAASDIVNALPTFDVRGSEQSYAPTQTYAPVQAPVEVVAPVQVDTARQSKLDRLFEQQTQLDNKLQIEADAAARQAQFQTESDAVDAKLQSDMASIQSEFARKVAEAQKMSAAIQRQSGNEPVAPAATPEVSAPAASPKVVAAAVATLDKSIIPLPAEVSKNLADGLREYVTLTMVDAGFQRFQSEITKDTPPEAVKSIQSARSTVVFCLLEKAGITEEVQKTVLNNDTARRLALAAVADSGIVAKISDPVKRAAVEDVGVLVNGSAAFQKLTTAVEGPGGL